MVPVLPINGLSVDVEDWFQVGAFENVIERAEWDGLADRVESNCAAILDMFAEADVKATFFTLGWVAERYPQIVREIAKGEGREARIRELKPGGMRPTDIARMLGIGRSSV